MKKITRFITALTVLTSILMLCSCGLKNAIDETHNKWYKYNNENGINVPLGDDSSEESASAATLEGAEFYLYFDDDDGLEVVIQKDTTQTVGIAGGLLTQDVTITTGAKKQYTKEQFGSVKWGLLVASGKIVPSSKPKLVANPDGCIDISEALGNGIQWKKVLKQILINQLLGE